MSRGASFNSHDTLSRFPKSTIQAPSYRNKQAAERLAASHYAFMEKKEPLDEIQTERSQRISKDQLKKDHYSSLRDEDDFFSDQPTYRTKEIAPKKEKAKKSNISSFMEQPSILENAEEVGNFELFGRIVSAYYDNLSFSLRRILLRLGSNIDKQRDAEIRRQKAMTDNVLARQNPELDQIEAEISKIDKQNLLNVMIVAALVAFVLVLLFR